MDKTWTVYVHINKINSKKYVGVTCKELIRRWGTTGNGYKGQAFWFAIQKYGWDNFEHKIIAEGLTEKEAKEMEIKLIEELNSDIHKNGYNVTKGGDGYLGCDNHGENNPMYGRHHSEETKALLSKLSTGRPNKWKGCKHTEESKAKMRGPRPSIAGKNHPRYGKPQLQHVIDKSRKVTSKPVMQLDLDFNLIKEYKCILDAEKETGISRHHIIHCCRNNPPYESQYIWVYKKDYPLSDEKIQEITTYYYRYGIQRLDLNGNLIAEYLSSIKAGELLGIDRKKIGKACKNHSIYEDSYWQYFDYSIHNHKTLKGVENV